MSRTEKIHSGVVNGFKIIHYEKQYYYLVECPVCHKQKIIRLDGLRTNKSCGCIKGHTTHGISGKNKIYFMWHDMKTRCYNPKSDRFSCYGKRGISVCDEWRRDYKKFHDWVIDNGWEKGLQIDRIDNDGNYEPANCRFVSNKINSRKRQNTVWVNLNGKKLCFAEACEILKLDRRAYKAIHILMKSGKSFKTSVDGYIKRRAKRESKKILQTS